MKQVLFSDVDSQRFGINVYRATLDEVEIENLKEQIKSDAIDLIILRLPSATKDQHSALHQLGFQVIHADTLVYYFCTLNNEITPLRNELSFEVISEENKEILNEIVPIIFKDYTSHYASNPMLDRAKTSEGYIEWAKSYVTTANPNRISWLVKSENAIIGFATCSFNVEKNDCEGVLYGVMPDASGKGVYTDIIRFTQSYFKDLGYKTMWVSTQIQNYSVQKAWIKENFQLKKALDTYHIICKK
jgi:predicted acetyltransferase